MDILRICRRFVPLTTLLGAIPACTGIEPAVIGAGATAAETGVTLLDTGSLKTFELARFEDLVAAAERAGASLGLSLLNEVRKDGYVWRYYRYGDRDKLVVTIRRQTPSVTTVRLKVGAKADQAMAALYLRVIYDDLRDSGAYLEEWVTEEPIQKRTPGM